MLDQLELASCQRWRKLSQYGWEKMCVVMTLTEVLEARCHMASNDVDLLKQLMPRVIAPGAGV